MKKIILFICFIIVSTSFGQTPLLDWSKTIGGSNFEFGYQVIETIDGGLLISGQTNSNDGDIETALGQKDIFIIKLDDVGSVVWKKVFGGSGSEDGVIKLTPDGGFIIGGSTSSNDGDVTNNHGSTDYWLVKASSTGDIEWQKTYGGSYDENMSHIVINTNGTYTLFGLTNSDDGDVIGYHGMMDLWIVNVDSTGDIQWQKSLGGSEQESPRDIKATSDNGVIVYSHTVSHNGDIEGVNGGAHSWLVKLSEFGSLEWQQFVGYSGQHFPTNVEQTVDGGYVAATTASYQGSIDIFIKKFSSAGEVEWETPLGGSGYEEGIVKQSNDGGYIVSAYTQSSDGDASTSNGMFDLLLVKLTEDGERDWVKTYGGDNWDYFPGAVNYYSHHFSDANILQTNDGGYVIAAATQSYNSGDVTGGYNATGGIDDIWVLRINGSGDIEWQKPVGGTSGETSNGVIQTTSGEFVLIGTTYSNDYDALGNHGNADILISKFELESLLAPDFNLEEIVVYPNPATIHLIVSLPVTGSVDEAYIVNMLGQKSKTEINNNIIDIKNLATGIYNLEVLSNGKTYRQKFIKK